jgi:tetratricopeptide (TPR) repeat protein
VEPLVEHLGQSYSVWADWRSLVPGDPFEDEIEQGLRSCAALIAVLSERSVERKWPRREWRNAVERYFAPVIPFVVEEKALEKRPRCLRHLHYERAFPAEIIGGGRAEYRPEVLDRLQEALESHLLPRGQVMIDPWRSAAGAGQSPALRPVGRSFVGRETELRRLVRAIGYGVLLYGGTRQEETVIVHGVGGVGKSMLAAELARRIGPRYPGGVILERRGRRPEQDLLAVLCKWSGYLTGTPPTAIEPEVLRRQMHRAGTLLVILDDVWDEGDGDTVRVLCNEALPPGTDRIVTTRDAHLQTRIGGKLFSLDRLSREDGVALLRDRLQGQGKPPGKRLLEGLWNAVGGHALALELVAGRVLGSSLGPSFLSRLEAAIRAGNLSQVARLTVDDPSKEMSVAVSFDLSWQDLLDTDSRLGTYLAPRFARLAVLAEEAPFTVDAAAAVWAVDPDEAEDTLAELTRRALLNHLGEREYSQHPLVHGYAVGRLREAGAEAEAARRHLRFYRGVVAGFDEKSWRETERQAANIAVAGARAADGLPAAAIEALGGPASGQPTQDFDVEAARDAMELALAARDYVWRRRVHEGRRWLAAGVAAARLLGEPRAEATLLTELGVWFNERGKRAMAECCFRSALERWEALAESGERDDRYGLGRVLTNLGILSRAVDRQKEALALYHRALPIRRDIGDREGEQIVLGCIGVVHRDLGRHEEAIEYYRRSLEIAEQLGDLFGQSVNLNNWGRALRDLGRGEEAVELHVRATELAERCGNDSGVAINRNNLGCVYYDQGAYEKALAELEQAVPIRESILDLPRLAVSYHNLGLTLGTLGRRDEALKRLEQALEIEQEVDDFAGRASTLYTRASLLHELGRSEEAAAALAEAERVLAERGLDRTSAGTSQAEIRDLLTAWRQSERTRPRPAPPI